ncbi:MAG: EH signature domain-containing protein [Rhodothermales bacterium]
MRASEKFKYSFGLNRRVLPPLDEIRRGVERITKRWPDVVTVPEDRDREKLAMEMLSRVKDWDWNDIKTARITAAAIAVFDSERCSREDLEPVRQFYIDEIAEHEAGSFIDGMVFVYIETFQKGAKHTRILAKALFERRAVMGTRLQPLLSALPNLFMEKRIPSDVAAIMLSAEDPYLALKDVGIKTPHGSGLTNHAHKIFVTKIATKLRMEAARKKLFNWLIPKSGTALQNGAGEAVEALLAAWRTETPPEEIQQEMSELIVSAYNDPRLHRGGIWSGFDPDLRAILLRWLTKQDMKFFCDMVTATQNSHMWPPRRDFWLQLYEDGDIDEAWVAFGRTAQEYAHRQLSKASHADRSRRFGKQVSSEDKSLLIMRIFGKIVVDGCHSYKTHIFREDDPKAPKLYGSRYDSNKVRDDSKLSQTHYWSETNKLRKWEEWVMQHV